MDKKKFERKLDKATAKRLMSYIGAYKVRFICVLICIVLSSLAVVVS